MVSISCANVCIKIVTAKDITGQAALTMTVSASRLGPLSESWRML